jgi:hypothetical protein
MLTFWLTVQATQIWIRYCVNKFRGNHLNTSEDKTRRTIKYNLFIHAFNAFLHSMHLKRKYVNKLWSSIVCVRYGQHQCTQTYFSFTIHGSERSVYKTIINLTVYGPVVTKCTTRFTIQQFHVLPSKCIFVFCVDLRRNSHYFPIQH